MNNGKKLLKDALVSLLVEPGRVVSLKGDVSLKETIEIRQKNRGIFDDNLQRLQENVTRLLRDTGVYYLNVEFNRGVVKTSSVFDRFSYEIHSGEDFLDNEYLENSFPEIPYEIKEKYAKGVLEVVFDSDIMEEYVPEDWKKLISFRNKSISFPDIDTIYILVGLLNKLREIEKLFIRSYCINIVQGIIELQFNCDGSTIVNIDEFQRFVDSLI